VCELVRSRDDKNKHRIFNEMAQIKRKVAYDDVDTIDLVPALLECLKPTGVIISLNPVICTAIYSPIVI
jgi:hypothetical protein